MKKRGFRILSVILSLLLLSVCAVISVSAAEPSVVTDNTLGTVSYTLYDDGVLKINGTGAVNSNLRNWGFLREHWDEITSVVIEEGITSVKESAFGYGNNITSVELPSSMERLEEYAFWGCSSLVQVNEPEHLTFIGGGVFQESVFEKIGTWDNHVLYWADCAINTSNVENIVIRPATKCIASMFIYSSATKTVTIPASVVSIAEAPIITPNIESITVDAGNENYYCDCNCLIEKNTGKILAGFGEFKIPTDGSIKEIGTYAYRGRTIENLTIPEGVTKIAAFAFYNSRGYKEIHLPSTLSEIGDDNILHWRGVNIITVNDSNNIYAGTGNCLIEKSSKTLLLGANNSTIPADGSVEIIAEFAFCDCIKLKEITIPNTVKKINWGAFYECSNLESVIIPDSVTWVSGLVFADCVNLKSVTMSQNVERLNQRVFMGCTALEEFIIPDSVISTEDAIFHSCTSLKKLHIGKNLHYFDHNILNNAENLQTITVDAENTHLYVTNGCLIDRNTKTLIVGTNNAVIPTDGSVTSILENAFCGRTTLTEIIIPDTVITIGEGAFCYCIGLTTVTLPTSVSEIKSLSFSGCNNLQSMTIMNPNCIINPTENNIRQTTIPTTTVLYGEHNSTVKTYAEKYGNSFIGTDAHSMQPVAATASTCKTEGHSAYNKCTQCAFAETPTVYPVDYNNHTDADGNHYCDACGISLGGHDAGPSFFEKIAAFFEKIIEFFRNLFS